MTLVRMQPHACDDDPTPSHRTVDQAMEATGPQVGDDMTVEVALAVMAGARTDRLLVSDEHGLCTGLVSHARLAALRGSAAWTDAARLRDVLGVPGPFPSPMTTMADAERAMLHGRLDALPVVDEEGSAVGILALTR